MRHETGLKTSHIDPFYLVTFRLFFICTIHLLNSLILKYLFYLYNTDYFTKLTDSEIYLYGTMSAVFV